ncbi:hypothetical protein ACFTY9_30010 [Streptomyces sp. NPDC057021]
MEAATGLGGVITSPVVTSAASRWVDIADPDGARFTVAAPQDPLF